MEEKGKFPLVRKRYRTMRLDNLSFHEYQNVVHDRHLDKIDLSKVKAVIYSELPNGMGKVTFVGQEDCTYNTKCTMQMFFEDVFSKEYDSTWMDKYGIERLED